MPGALRGGGRSVLVCIYSSCVHIYRYRRAGGSGAIDKTRSSETWETWELSRQDSLGRDLGDLAEAVACRPACCRHSSPAELRRVAHMASQELPRGGRERVSGVSHLPCEQLGAHTESGTQRPYGAGFLPLVTQEGLPGEISRPCSWTPDRLTHTTARPLAFRQERTQKGEGEIRGDVRCSSVRRGCRGSSQSPSRGVSWD